LRKPKPEPLTPWYHEDDISPIPFNTVPFLVAAAIVTLFGFWVMTMMSGITGGFTMISVFLFPVGIYAIWTSAERGNRDLAVIWACGIWIPVAMMFFPHIIDLTYLPGPHPTGSLLEGFLIPYINSVAIGAAVYSVVGVVIVPCVRWFLGLTMLVGLWGLLLLWFISTMRMTGTWL
jgi:hypothetical protein